MSYSWMSNGPIPNIRVRKAAVFSQSLTDMPTCEMRSTWMTGSLMDASPFCALFFQEFEHRTAVATDDPPAGRVGKRGGEQDGSAIREGLDEMAAGRQPGIDVGVRVDVERRVLDLG